MIIRVRLFAHMAEHAGEARFSVEVPEQSSLAGVRSMLEKRHPGWRWPAGTLLAVNQEYATGERILREQDEVAIIPPVSGG